MWAPKDISQAGVRQVAEEESRRGDERTQSIRIWSTVAGFQDGRKELLEVKNNTQPAREWGLQSCNCIELKFATTQNKPSASLSAQTISTWIVAL